MWALQRQPSDLNNIKKPNWLIASQNVYLPNENSANKTLTKIKADR